MRKFLERGSVFKVQGIERALLRLTEDEGQLTRADRDAGIVVGERLEMRGNSEVGGTVSSVDLTQSPPLLSINGSQYTLSQVKAVGAGAASSSSGS